MIRCIDGRTCHLMELPDDFSPGDEHGEPRGAGWYWIALRDGGEYGDLHGPFFDEDRAVADIATKGSV